VNKHTAILPDGTIATRNSDSRIYTVAIVRVCRTNDDRRNYEAQIARYQRWIAKGTDTVEDMARWVKNLDQYTRLLEATPADEVRYAAVSWSSNEATARKRLGMDEILVPCTMVQSKPRAK